MTVTTPAGFRSAGIAVGLKSTGKPDLALVENLGPRFDAAVVFTSNRAQAHPVIWSRAVAQGGEARAIVLNSGGANCFTGDFGADTTRLTAEAVADALSATAGQILVCSTGLIGTGDQAFRDKIVHNVPTLVGALSEDDTTAPAAILTTDSVEKTAVHEGAGWSIGAMAKGAGMLAPGLATMLVVITTDALLPQAELDTALRHATATTFDRLDSDGCMSTNDTVIAMASGAAMVQPSPEELAEAVTAACAALALQLIGDAEGASKDIAIFVSHARSEDEAVEVARAVARSNLLKCAIHGEDPNWGRVLSAIGTTAAAFDSDAVDVAINGVWVCRGGAAGESRDLVDMSARTVRIAIDLSAGESEATVWTNDLTADYVHENSAYST